MTDHWNGVFLLNALVNFLLLVSAGRLCGYPAKWGRAVLAALLGGVHACVCLMPGFYFLGNILWRLVSLAGMAVIAYGLNQSALRRGAIFAFLSLALGGAVIGMGKGGFWGILCAAGILCLLCSFGFRGRIGGVTYIPIELTYGKKHLHLTALQDTGNTLRDPLTGRQVLVIGADTAGELTGLTREQLRDPVGSLGTLPGLRLIPYRTVDSHRFMLAMRFQNVKIGSWQGSSLVAFSPEGFSPDGAYQALTGGML